MLDQLLQLLRAGGTHRVSDLAHELETTPALVEAMLEGLVRMGHLRQVSEACSEECAACGLASLCVSGEGGRVWALTEKMPKAGGHR